MKHFKIKKSLSNDRYYIFEQKSIFKIFCYYKPLRSAGWFGSINSAAFYLSSQYGNNFSINYKN